MKVVPALRSQQAKGRFRKPAAARENAALPAGKGCETCLRQTSREGVQPGRGWVWGIKEIFYLSENRFVSKQINLNQTISMKTITIRLEYDSDYELLKKILSETRFKAGIETYEDKDDDLTDKEFQVLEERWERYKKNPASGTELSAFKKEMKKKYGV